ncbi:acyl-CoA/acyl-ACP dehydrogenase [Streptomyces sp. RB6PN25]|uniref:Acyl-CoA/acyl-ACP dehydrogenase n=1 Tax=Streptomyces humicola TaxID=2953240 RepID=A0ABT1PSP9_9ACTN|nr:acyl-CoA dehydrogenase family protein [Streptomyces humicola]MCQ4080703.1 acyl-CoA/acyl-ACP dehydrogenase [Streptomyces humicola]
MDFQLTDDQRALRAGVRELLAGRFPRERLREAVDRARVVDRGLWRELGAAGFFSLRMPEDAGGAGLGTAEAVLVFEEAGRVLLPGPLVATHLAAGHVEGAAEGEAVVAVAEPGVGGTAMVEYLAQADALLVGTEEGVRLRVLAADAADVADAASAAAQWAVRPVRSVDPLTPLHRVAVGEAGALGPTGGGPIAGVLGLPVGRFRREATLLTAAEQCGSAARTVEMAVEYAGVRHQFGQAIGTFQAVKHLCADMLVRAEMGRTAVYAAAVTGDPQEAAAAKLLADEAAVRNARDCLQVFGGMGFTWEADVHLHLKRAWVRVERFMGAREAEEALAAGLS